ncbi:hypothetical protein LTR67_003514 [Exophiala xenobiotica]
MELPDSEAITLAGTVAASQPASHDGAVDSSPFCCNICKRSYTRVDHLARHYRSHTREKPFGCEVCGKSFARADLLKRHVNGHNQNNSGGRNKPATKPNHSRVSRACLACAETKLRCDGAWPCGRCKTRDIACRYGKERSKKGQAASWSQQDEAGSTLSSGTVLPPDIAADGPTELNSHNQIGNNESPRTAPPPPSPPNILVMNPMLDTWPNGNADSTAAPFPGPFHRENPESAAIDASDALAISKGISTGSPFLQPDSQMTFDDLPLIDFIRTTMTPIPTDIEGAFDMGDFHPFPRDLMDFNIDQSFETDWTQFASDLLVDQNLVPSSTVRFDIDAPPPTKDGTITPGGVIRGSVSLGQQAFKESVWLWTPKFGDCGSGDRANLSSAYDYSKLGLNGVDTPPILEQMSLATRDRVLAMVLKTTDVASVPLVVARFPPPELLTKFVNYYLIHHLQSDTMWIHVATLRINEESAEFLAAMIAAGASGCGIPEFRKLGLAFQEAVRIALPERFENDNRLTRNLRSLQAYAIQLRVSLWSGDRRKMELAESFAQPLITMIRRAGHFRRNRDAEIIPLAEDDNETIRRKWSKWVEAESFKRLALHMFLCDTETSISLLNQPLISYAELSLGLPSSPDLWMAKSAREWKDLYLSRQIKIKDCYKSVRHCLHDTSIIFDSDHVIDVQMALAVVLSSIWALIWQCRKMRETIPLDEKGKTRNHSSTVNFLHQEITQMVQHLTLNAAEWGGGMKPGATLLRELSLMHLHVSLGDVQVLAGKEGEEEARAVFPLLSAWAESTESRRSIFHAGQVFRAAKQYLTGMLRDASAVAVYHASLAFWAYAIFCNELVVSKADQEHAVSEQTSPHDGGRTPGYVRLDAADSTELQRFLVLGKGIPCIGQWVPGHDSDYGDLVPLSDPVRVMATMTDFLHKKNAGDKPSRPALVMNLTKLMSSLGAAAVAGRNK